MKKINLLFLTLFFIQISKAQDYVPFPEDSVYWLSFTDELGGGPGGVPNCASEGFSRDLYFSFEDTIIESKEYRLVKKTNLVKTTDYYETDKVAFTFNDALKNARAVFAYRNDSLNKKVYARKLSSRIYFSYEEIAFNEEFIWYDFDLSLGDTLNYKSTYFHSEWNDLGFTVDSIDSIEICGKFHKRYFSLHRSGYSDQEEIIEGIGNGLGFMEDNLAFYFEPCAFTIWEMHKKGCGNFMDELINITSTQKIINTITLNVFPNPATGYLNLGLNDLKKYQITDINGRIIFSQSGESNVINTRGLSPGTYLLRAETKNNQFGWTTFVKK